MAGRGLRFREAGFNTPKFAIRVRGRSLLEWSLTSLHGFIADGAELVFLAQRLDDAREAVAHAVSESGAVASAFRLVELDSITDGQATTALHAAAEIGDLDAPLLIYNTDTFVEPRYLRPLDVRGDGWIPCFDAPGEHWSFVRAGEDGRVFEVREKRRISAHASVGLYYFASFTVYREAYDRCYGSGDKGEAGERYIAPLYNELVSQGRPVFLHTIPPDRVHPLGTPEEVARFEGARQP